LTACCAVVVWRAPLAAAKLDQPPGEEEKAADGLTLGRQLRWLALAFVPSSLLLGVTTYVTTDIAAIPLLWVIPLAIYLLTFILVFSPRPLVPHSWMVHLLPVVALVVAVTLLLK